MGITKRRSATQMRFWTFVEMDTNTMGESFTRWVTMSDQEILDYYWDNWSGDMKRAFYDKRMLNATLDDITPENCIHDFCIAHWAERNHWREMKDNYE